jgi:hypothetical protein
MATPRAAQLRQPVDTSAMLGSSPTDRHRVIELPLHRTPPAGHQHVVRQDSSDLKKSAPDLTLAGNCCIMPLRPSDPLGG